MRGRSYSYSPSPSRDYRRRRRSPSPRRGCRRSREPPTSLLVRNLRRDCRPEDLRGPFGRFGPIRDIYLPCDYYTRELRGFGFVEFVHSADAADAKYEMNGYVLHGRELSIVFAEENRKKPSEMRARQRSRGRASDRRYSPDCYDSRSPSCYERSYSRSPDYYSPNRRCYSRSLSPRERSRSYDRGSYSRSPCRSRSHSRSPYSTRSHSIEYSR